MVCVGQTMAVSLIGHICESSTRARGHVLKSQSRTWFGNCADIACANNSPIIKVVICVFDCGGTPAGGTSLVSRTGISQCVHCVASRCRRYRPIKILHSVGGLLLRHKYSRSVCDIALCRGSLIRCSAVMVAMVIHVAKISCASTPSTLVVPVNSGIRCGFARS